MHSRRKIFLVFSLVFALCLAACTGKETENSGKPVVYVSFYPVNDLVRQVAGDTVEVRNFMPLDKTPHLWEPTPKDIKNLAQADLLVVNGANIESWIDQVRESLPELRILTLSDSVELISYKGAAVTGDFQYMCQYEAEKDKEYKIHFSHTHEDTMRIAFIDNSEDLPLKELVERGKAAMEKKGRLTPQRSVIEVEEGRPYNLEMSHEQGEIYFKFPSEGKWIFLSDRISEPLLPYELQDKDTAEKLKVEVLLEGSTSGMDKVTYDPHSWLSLKNSRLFLNAIHDTLVELYPSHSRSYYKKKVKAVDQITDLFVEYEAKFKELDKKEFIVTHYAYEYLAREFGLVQFPLQGLVSTDSPSLKTIRKAIDYSNYKQIKTIFYEYGTDPKAAVALAEEIGGEAVGLTSMEYKTDQMKEEVHYQDVMRYNLEKLYESLAKEAQ
ncbi:MAG: zinc ABC transporter substrate-binding protein [Peptostreptococcaceae bacterium]|nr:zinc ABC transporter substrate-binding protein [Peptostreptococcaceae bacterium]